MCFAGPYFFQSKSTDTTALKNLVIMYLAVKYCIWGIAIASTATKNLVIRYLVQKHSKYPLLALHSTTSSAKN